MIVVEQEKKKPLKGFEEGKRGFAKGMEFSEFTADDCSFVFCLVSCVNTRCPNPRMRASVAAPSPPLHTLNSVRLAHTYSMGCMHSYSPLRLGNAVRGGRVAVSQGIVR